MELLWTDFLNSDWHDWRGSGRSEDRLDKPEWLERFLAAWHLQAPVPPAPPDTAALKAARELLRGLAQQAAAEAALTERDLGALNELLRAGPVARQLTAGRRLELAPLTTGWAAVIAEVAASFAQTLSAGEGARIRICDNPDCRWVFYDETRNRTKRFCDDKLCGNLMKVRRFRARQKAEPE